jgi:MFS family permease
VCHHTPVTPWIAAAGAFVVSLDSTVNVAFPAIAAAFATPPEAMRWVIVCYVLSYAVTAFAGGAAGDRLGHARVFRVGLAGSAAGFAVAGLAATFGWLLAGRVVQGVAAGLVYGTAPALATLGASPHRYGRRLGGLNAAIGAALTVGPAAAGVLVDSLGWRSVFHVRVPLVLATLAWATALPPAAGSRPGLVLAGLRRPGVVRAGTLAFLANGGIFAVWLLAPFYLIQQRGLAGWLAGVLFMLTPLATAVAAPLAGRAIDRVGARGLVVAGLAVEAASLLGLSRVGATTPLGWVAAGLFGAGLGLGVFQVPYMAAVMAAFPAGEQGTAGGFTFLARTLGIVAGVVALAGVFAARRGTVGFEPAFTEAFLLAAALVALATVLAIGRGALPAAAGRP